MPLFVFDAEAAKENIRGNPFNSWGNRVDANRIEPIARPSFDTPLHLNRGDDVFTVGSCFARNVEVELVKHGMNVPTRDLLKLPQFEGVEPGVLNNFGVSSIYNEFAWAFGEQDFNAEDNIIEFSPGKYIDLHLIAGLRPKDWDTTLTRREAVTAAYKGAAKCKLLIMTLGLSEVWFDTKTGLYLNTMPGPRLVKNNPGRFELHVLSPEETIGFLDKTLQIIQKHFQPDIRVMLTVSPVPLGATFRPVDVMIANTYSKSTLRAAAEVIVSRYDFVTYYPSYESITLSDRKIAYTGDMVHVSKEIVAFNIGRMLQKVLNTGDDLENVIQNARAGGLAAVLETGDRMIEEQAADTADFFGHFEEEYGMDPDFALRYGTILHKAGDYRAALAALDKLGDDTHDNVALVALRAEILLDNNRPQDAADLLYALVDKNQVSDFITRLLMRAAIAKSSIEDIDRVLHITSQRAGIIASARAIEAGLWHRKSGKLELALQRFKWAAEKNPSGTRAPELIEATEAMIRELGTAQTV